MEIYPPICNLIDYLSANSTLKIIVISTKNEKAEKLRSYKSDSKKVVIKRTDSITSNSGLRLLRYLFFYLKCFHLLLKYAPKTVLYFDTISSWPALMYKKIKGSKVKLLAHYHEYCSPGEYDNNMRLTKVLHRMEAKMYFHSYDWISQTNEARLQKMIKDNQLENTHPSVFHIMPNYPSKYWAKGTTLYGVLKKIRLVYVGSLGYDTTYLNELIDWVIKNKDQFTLDFYAYNIDKKAKDFLEAIEYDFIRFHEGINYEELPDILYHYDVGLVIYKPISYNWIQNAPNKMFEYLACGLDVWFSKTMAYATNLTTEQTFPKIIAIDFEKLEEFDFEKAVNRTGLSHRETDFFYENVYYEIFAEIRE